MHVHCISPAELLCTTDTAACTTSPHSAPPVPPLTQKNISSLNLAQNCYLYQLTLYPYYHMCNCLSLLDKIHTEEYMFQYWLQRNGISNIIPFQGVKAKRRYYI